MKTPITDIQTIPFQGGCNTVLETNLIPSGGYSMIQNMRSKHPGFEKRKGCIKKHTEADGTNKVMSLYQFRKAKRTEYHLFAQMSDGDVLEATHNPPTVTTGAFGSEVFDGTTNPIAASWSNCNDIMAYSNGVDQHKVYSGNYTPVRKFIVYVSAAAIPTIPIEGKDYSDEVSDGLSSTVAVLDSLGTLAQYDCIFLMTPIRATRLDWTVTLPNGSTAAAQLKYCKNDSTWAAPSGFADNTELTPADGKTLGKSGSMTWTLPSDEIARYMFGACGYWYQVSLASGALDSEVEVSEVTFDGPWQSIENVWDGVPIDIIEFQFYDQSAGVYKTFGAGSIELDSMTSSDIGYFSTPDNIEAFYIDVGKKPNTTAATTATVSRWDGGAWQTMTISDQSTGCNKSGWVHVGRNTAFQQQFGTTDYYSYWWKIQFNQTFNDDVIISMSYMPYFDISELGKSYCNCSWKDRMCYSFDRWGKYIYVSQRDGILNLNGDDYGILEAGDGRQNKIAAMRRFHNELMVWQEEKGADGGTLTLFEGYSPITYGKLLISSRLGAMNSKCVEIVDGVLTKTATEEKFKTLAFALSRYGVYVTDGTVCSFVDDEIKNYFDPNESECIRAGYESEMWLKHDSAYNVIRIGLVSGSSATVPNVFPVFNLQDKTWSFDALGQPLSCMAECEAASGAISVLQLGGGTADGFVYQLNTTGNDVNTAIDSFATMELDGKGERFNLREMILRTKVQSAGNVTLTPYNNGVAQTAMTLSMTAESTNEVIRRNRVNLNHVGHHLSLKFQNSTASQSMLLTDVGLRLFAYKEQ